METIANDVIRYQVGIKDVTLGKNVKVVEPLNLYGCTIGDNCFIGPFVEIQKDVTIGNNTKIQSHSFICELVTIGNSCFIGHGVMFINDLFQTGAPAGGKKNYGNTPPLATMFPLEVMQQF